MHVCGVRSSEQHRAWNTLKYYYMLRTVTNPHCNCFFGAHHPCPLIMCTSLWHTQGSRTGGGTYVLAKVFFGERSFFVAERSSERDRVAIFFFCSLDRNPRTPPSSLTWLAHSNRARLSRTATRQKPSRHVRADRSPSV